MKLISHLFITAICALQSWVTPIATAFVMNISREEYHCSIQQHKDTSFIVKKKVLLYVERSRVE